MSPVARTCVPPQSSVLNAPSPIATTRTLSPYFSPKSAIAPDAIASCVFLTDVFTVSFLRIGFVDDPLDLLSLLRSDSGEVDEVESQPIGRDERARLLDVSAKHLP